MTDERVVPICADCKHLVGKRGYKEDAKTWKCGHPSNLHEVSKDLVSGDNIYAYHNSTCYDARASAGLCQPAGTLYEKYERPELFSKPKASLLSADDLLGELGL